MSPATASNHPLSPAPSNRAISDSTKKKYLSILRGAKNKITRKDELGYYIDPTPLDLVKDLYARKTEYRPKTFLLYRTALVWWVGQLEVDQIDDLVKEAWTMLHQEVPRDGFKDDLTIYSTKSSRPRTISKKNLGRLLDELSYRADRARTHVEKRRASELQYWIHAGLATGLRPIEWEQAFWSNREKGELSAFTAKRKMSNYSLPHISHLSDAHAIPLRTVYVQEEQDRVWIDLHLKSIQLHFKEGKVFKNYYDNNRIYLKNVSDAVFKKEEFRVTLYMLRGQFAANRKISGQPFEDISKEMGNSTHHLSRAYGNKVHGYKSLRGGYQNKDTQMQKETNCEEASDSFDSDYADN